MNMLIKKIPNTPHGVLAVATDSVLSGYYDLTVGAKRYISLEQTNQIILNLENPTTMKIGDEHVVLNNSSVVQEVDDGSGLLAVLIAAGKSAKFVVNDSQDWQEVTIASSGGGGSTLYSALVAKAAGSLSWSSGNPFYYVLDSVIDDPNSIYSAGVFTIPAGLVGTKQGKFNIAVTSNSSSFTGHATIYFQVFKSTDGGSTYNFHRASAPFGSDFSSENMGFNGVVPIVGAAGDKFKVRLNIYGNSDTVLNTPEYSWIQLQIG